jgi:hypothetical protein
VTSLHLRESMLTEPLPRSRLHNPVVLLLRAHIAGCLSSHYLVMCWHVTIFCGMSVESNKKKRKVINMDTKLDVIKWFDNGQSKVSISRALGLKESPIWLILSKSNEYIVQGKVASTSFSTVLRTINRSSILVETEYLLITWLEDCNQKWTTSGT